MYYDTLDIEDLYNLTDEEIDAHLAALDCVRVNCTACGASLSLDDCVVTQKGEPYCRECYKTHVDPKHHVRDHWRNWKIR